MIRQYHPHRYRIERLPNGRTCPVGSLCLGTIVRIPIRRAGWPGIKIRSVLIEAWMPRRIGGWRRKAHGHEDAFVANGMWQAHVRDLGDDSRTWMADRTLLHWYNVDPRWDPPSPARSNRPFGSRALTLRGVDGVRIEMEGAM